MQKIACIALTVLLFSCKKDNDKSPPYFAFDNTAIHWQSNDKVHDTIFFKSNLGAVKKYHFSSQKMLSSTLLVTSQVLIVLLIIPTTSRQSI